MRVATFLGLAAITFAGLGQPGDSFAAASPDSELAEARAQVRHAKAAVDRAKVATLDSRAYRDTIQGRAARNAAARDRSAQRLDDTRRAVNRGRERVRDARTRLQRANTPRARRAARHHLQVTRKHTNALRAANIKAKRKYLLAQEAADRAASALTRAQARLTETRSQLESARIVLVQAKEHYAELLARANQDVTTAVANIPNRISAANFKSSMLALVKKDPDFITLNEISSRTIATLRQADPVYGAYRGGARLTEPGSSTHSISNAVMWRSDMYEVVAKGRIKVVDDDRGYYRQKKFLWDRYATWVTLRSLSDGLITSVISTHMPTNPAKFPRQYGNPPLTRVQLYARGMNKLTALAGALAQQGPVLLGGDMNSHPNQGYWSAAAKMTAAGYPYAKDRGVMYLFHPLEATVTRSIQLRISSDHPALVTTLQFG
ncbi:MAG TPA: hypothetical protein VNQ53_19140 [Nocardioides sp.]|nr:hypothetical protein [Nocardioides sp.]